MATSTIRKEVTYERTSETLSNAVSVPANSYATVSIDITKSGYIPLSVSQLQTNSGASVIVAGWNMYNTGLTVVVRNFTSSAVQTRVAYKILYAKL